jgi:Skp family chaperone for outer membrane proteins
MKKEKIKQKKQKRQKKNVQQRRGKLLDATDLWMKQHLTSLLKLFVMMLVCSSLVFAKGKKYSDIVVAVLDWNAVVSVSPYAKEGDKAVEELWKKEEERIMELAKQLQSQLDAKPQQEKATFEEQARKQIADEIQKSSQLVQQETIKYVNLTVETIRGVVEKYCKENKIDLLISKQSGVLYSADAIDITDDIIKEVQNLKVTK